MIRISESEDFIVDYDRERGMYRVSVFNNGHFQDECWFDCYEERELNSNEGMIYITQKEYNELLEYKYMYEKLFQINLTIPDYYECKWIGGGDIESSKQ